MEVGTTAAALASRVEEEEEGHFYSGSNAEAKKAAFSRAHGLTPISLFSEKDAAKRKGPFSLSVGPAKDKLKVRLNNSSTAAVRMIRGSA